MEPLTILVLSSPVTDALDGDGIGGRICKERYPEMDWRFKSFLDCTEEDVLAADVITGHPRPQWLKNASKLRWLHLQSAGVNGYEKREIYAREDVIVTRAAGVHAPAMAEHALGMALSLTRRLPELYQRQQAGKWQPVHARKELGTGYLANAITPLVKAFGCFITGIRRDTGKPLPPNYDRMLPPEKLHEALSEADYIFSTLPFTEQTRHIFETNTLGITAKSTRIDDIMETVNHFRCIDYIIDHTTDKITEAQLKQLHLILKTNTSDSRKSWFAIGDYKRLPNEVGGEETVKPEDVSKHIRKLLAEYNALKEVQFDDILNFHVQFERIHPFQDGNGRVGRLLMFWQCLQSGQVPFIITEELRLFYYRGLQHWGHINGYLRDTCLTAQDQYKLLLNYFKIKY